MLVESSSLIKSVNTREQLIQNILGSQGVDVKGNFNVPLFLVALGRIRARNGKEFRN